MELLMVEHQGKTYAMTPQTLIEEVTYSCYRFNRQHAPDITMEQWLKVFPTALEMEERFKVETVGKEPK